MGRKKKTRNWLDLVHYIKNPYVLSAWVIEMINQYGDFVKTVDEENYDNDTKAEILKNYIIGDFIENTEIDDEMYAKTDKLTEIAEITFNEEHKKEIRALIEKSFQNMESKNNTVN